MHMAALFGRTEAVVALLGAGASVTEKDEEDMTPLHAAAFRGHVDAARVLVEAGASIEDAINAYQGHKDKLRLLEALKLEL